MEYEEVIRRLEEMGDERARKVWARVGMDTKNYFGVNLTKLKRFSKEVKKDHEIARKLWASKIHDAQLLACYIEEPKKVDEEQINRWMNDVDFIDLSDKFSTEVVFKTPFAKERMTSWIKDDREYFRRAGFVLLGRFAQKGKETDISEEELIDYLKIIENELQSERNWVREVMNYAVLHIGCRSPNLNKRAIEAAKKIGKVEVDFGESSCIVPDARERLALKDLKFKLI